MRISPIEDVDFLKLKPGLFVAQKEVIGCEAITVFDLRLKKPYDDEVLDTAVVQTIQHLLYDYVKKDALWGERIVFLAPCASRTAFFLIVKGDLISEEIQPLLERAFDYISDYKGPVPRSKPAECAYCLDLDLELEETRAICAEYYNLLISAKKVNLNYPVKKGKKKAQP
ncbi:MAG: S-ribosylhomocysteine lyase [Christensenellales bacterium]